MKPKRFSVSAFAVTGLAMVMLSTHLAQNGGRLDTTVEPVAHCLFEFHSLGWQIARTGTATGIAVFLQKGDRSDYPVVAASTYLKGR